MNVVAFYDTKPYDQLWFDRLKGKYGIELKYFENKLNCDTAMLAGGCQAAVAFVNDQIDPPAIDALTGAGVKALALRSAGYNNVDVGYAQGKLTLYRVPSYSPAAVAEHAMALLTTLCRKIHWAYNRTRDYNFSLKGLTGFELKGKTVGVVGTGKIGQAFMDICLGFGMKVIAYDPTPRWGRGIEYVSFDELCRRSDVISLHCPLTYETRHMLGRNAFLIMKDGVYIINTSRGALIESGALLEALKSGRVGGAGLDVYEEETEFFYEDLSGMNIRDDVLKLLIATPNVLVTSHQAFLTDEALREIAEITLQNLSAYFSGRESENEIRPSRVTVS